MVMTDSEACRRGASGGLIVCNFDSYACTCKLESETFGKSIHLVFFVLSRPCSKMNVGDVDVET